MKKHNVSQVAVSRKRALRRDAPVAEIILWTQIKARALGGYKFRRQYSIGPYIADFYCGQRKLVIEIDGDSHLQLGAKEYDKRRQDYIEFFGLRVVRFTNEEIYNNLEGVLEAILEILDRKAG